eukprot:TRINITY_DN14033_c0_g2_i1.p1 TRINITY_DN14033_c0_g2~~TRINITY_DN14033_c0_g2_i1.p1  ORF type:complete len:930 (+),score=373.12 TRINITY_DN14033_c0_g2_i1:78-2867(+)
MGRVAWARLAGLACLALSTSAAVLQDGDVTATLGNSGLTSLTIGAFNIKATEGPWGIGNVAHEGGNSTTGDCVSSGAPVVEGKAATIPFACGDGVTALVTYDVVAGRYLRRRVNVTATTNANSSASSTVLNLGFGDATPKNNIVPQGFHFLGAFVRFAPPAGASYSSLIVMLQAPYGSYQVQAASVTSGFTGIWRHTAGVGSVVATHLIGSCIVPEGDYTPELGSGLFTTEINEVKSAARALFIGEKRTTPITLQVGWDENDYCLDINSTDGLNAYKRIIQQNAALGNEYVIFAPQDAKHSNRFTPPAIDGWGWEHLLWFTMGKLVRTGEWDPINDPVPQDILDFVSYADSLGVKLLVYIYPGIPFAPLAKYPYQIATAASQTLDMANPDVQKWQIDAMSAFLTKTGAKGISFDHDFIAGSPDFAYQQYMGFRHIRAELTARHPDIVFDNRQNAHALGPFYNLENGYTEPLISDENPETYGIPMTSWHTDIVVATYVRTVNYRYSIKELIPMERMPGMISHQTERTADNGIALCAGTNDCYNFNTRDFDLLGYRYSLLSTVGTAGLNLMWSMIPARDESEFNLFPQEERDFISRWRQFAFDNFEVLKNTAPIASFGAPAFGKIDGTAAMKDCSGYIFLYNPNFDVHDNATFKVDMSTQLKCGSSPAGSQFKVSELFPQNRTVGVWTYADTVTLAVQQQGVLVLQVEACNGPCSLPPVVGASVVGGRLRGAMGTTTRVTVAREALDTLIPGKVCNVKGSGEDGSVQVDVQFAGERLVSPHRAAVHGSLQADDVWYNFTAEVTAGMQAQLKHWETYYPIPWDPAVDYSALWLAPSRLPLYFPFTAPDMSRNLTLYVNGTKTALELAGTSRGAKHYPRTFTGFWWNATDLVSAAPSSHSISLYSPTGFTEQGFMGPYWENLAEQYTHEIIGC